MLIVNGVLYNDMEKFIDFDYFYGVVDGKKRKGKALNITLKMSDFKLCIETVYDIEWIRRLKINDKKNIFKYIVGLSYEDKEGWMYFTDKCDCTINRINDNSFQFYLSGHFEECDEKFDIEYNDNIKF